MRYDINKNTGDRSQFQSKENLLATVYPGLYCPRCGSMEIGLLRLADNDAIWECRECDVKFRLVFPSYSRF